MSDAEFNDLMRGPLDHPLPMFSGIHHHTQSYCQASNPGEDGAEALRKHCCEREAKDGLTE